MPEKYLSKSKGRTQKITDRLLLGSQGYVHHCNKKSASGEVCGPQ